MRTIRTRTIAYALALAAVLSLAPLRAQTTQTTQAALSKEAGTLSDKFAGLARVMSGKYDWKPGEGVRSVGDVFNLIVTENSLLAGTLTLAGGGQGGGADRHEHLGQSIAYARSNGVVPPWSK
jgi:hypothetical protein